MNNNSEITPPKNKLQQLQDDLTLTIDFIKIFGVYSGDRTVMKKLNNLAKIILAKIDELNPPENID